MKCANCGIENKNTNIRCEFCGMELNAIEENVSVPNKDYTQANMSQIDLGSKNAKYIEVAILMFMFAPFIFTALAFIGVSAYSNISDYNKSKNYLETEGRLVGYENFRYDDDGDELCTAVYEYTVNGVTYESSPDLLSDRSAFKLTAMVKYDPDNPNQYVMNSGWNKLFIVGIIMLVVIVIVIIFIHIKIKSFFS